MNAGDLLRVRPGYYRMALLATGPMVKVAKEISAIGLDAEAWSEPSINPLSYAQLTPIAQRVEAIITLEEHSVLGAIVPELLSTTDPLPIFPNGIEDRFSAARGSREYLLQEHGLDVPAIQRRIAYFIDS